MTTTARLWTAASALLLLGCYHAGRTHPLPGALRATSTHSVREIATAALAALDEKGIAVEQYRPDTGLVESVWFDVSTLEARARDYPPGERGVRFRFIAVADTAGGATHIYLEVVQHGLDPLGSRRSEREVPSDHPAMSVARQLMDRLTDRLR